MIFGLQAIKNLIPLGFIERHRRNFRMGRLGLPFTLDVATAVDNCRYELWPEELRHSKQPWTLVDVGANQGEFIAAAAKIAKIDRVYAFEPLPACQMSLKEVLKVIPEGALFSAAVGVTSGELEFLCTANSKMSSLLAPSSQVACEYQTGDFAITERITVPLVSLDDVIPPEQIIGLLKIDVQGYELSVLEGATKTLCNSTAVLLEVNYIPHYEGGATFDDVCSVMRMHGFRTFGISAPYIGHDGPMWADAMFVRAG